MQTRHYEPNAAGLADFVVEGEKRYWLHPPTSSYGEAGIAIEADVAQIVSRLTGLTTTDTTPSLMINKAETYAETDSGCDA